MSLYTEDQAQRALKLGNTTVDLMGPAHWRI